MSETAQRRGPGNSQPRRKGGRADRPWSGSLSTRRRRIRRYSLLVEEEGDLLIAKGEGGLHLLKLHLGEGEHKKEDLLLL